MNRNDKLWSELSREEKAEEKRDFLESYVLELGGKTSDYQMEWEQYLNQEGWTGRDEEIMMKRDREYALAKQEDEVSDRRHPSTSCTCSVCHIYGLSDAKVYTTDEFRCGDSDATGTAYYVGPAQCDVDTSRLFATAAALEAVTRERDEARAAHAIMAESMHKMEAQRNEARAELAKLEAHHESMHDRVPRDLATIARLREALERYGDHTPTCQARAADGLRVANWCDCGFSAALAESES